MRTSRMSNVWRPFALALLAFLPAAACEEGGASVAPEPDAGAGDAAPEPESAPIELTPEQVQLGCIVMGEGESAHVMCNHGHSLSLRSENLYQRWLLLDAMGETPVSEPELMMSDGMLPPPLTPLLEAAMGERVRIRVLSYGPEMHDFHVHGHLWTDGDGTPVDTHPLLPAEVYDGIEFYAGGGADDPEPRAGPGDWMYHCHVETHVASGMWGVFRVKEAGDTSGTLPDGRYPTEVPAPLGGPGETVDVWIVAAEVPLSVSREYLPGAPELITVDRIARLYLPMPDEAAFLAATAPSIKSQMQKQKESFLPWVLSLRLGTTVRVHLRNVMAEAPCSLHPHGVAYEIGDDGTMPDDVAWPGGDPVVQTWVADTPGTWPLHDHARILENVGRGLFAAIVVTTPEEEAALDRDYLVVFHDYDMDWMMGFEPGTGGGHSGH